MDVVRLVHPMFFLLAVDLDGAVGEVISSHEYEVLAWKGLLCWRRCFRTSVSAETLDGHTGEC